MAEVQTGRGFYILRCEMNQYESAHRQLVTFAAFPADLPPLFFNMSHQVERFLKHPNRLDLAASEAW